MAAKKKNDPSQETSEEKKNRYENPNESFYWLGLVTTKKQPRSLEEVSQYYMPFMVNKGLSYYPDTVNLVNEMNCSSHLSNRMQFDFLYKLVPKGKRYEKWLKPEKEERIKNIQELYSVSRSVAREMLEILNLRTDSEESFLEISERIYTGGRNKPIRDS